MGTARADGTQQVTSNRQPMYGFVKDRKQRQANGQSATAVELPGSRCPHSGTQVSKAAAAPAPSGASSPAAGY